MLYRSANGFSSKSHNKRCAEAKKSLIKRVFWEILAITELDDRALNIFIGSETAFNFSLYI